MVATGAVRIVIWGGGAILAGSAFGMDWVMQEVSIPLWGLLVLTFVPTRDLIQAAQDILDAVVAKVAGEKKLKE